jgi:RNA polymerase sigma-70 factor (ECF subfamily)
MGSPDRTQIFSALFSQMAPRLYRTALGLLGNPHDAADAVQEAGLKAFRYFDRLQNPEAGPAWLTRTVINACYDHGRKRARSVPGGLVPTQCAEAPATAAPDWELISLLQTLPEEQKRTVVLRFMQDLSTAQIAQVMQVPEGTVKSRLHTALSKLRSELRTTEREGAQ